MTYSELYIRYSELYISCTFPNTEYKVNASCMIKWTSVPNIQMKGYGDEILIKLKIDLTSQIPRVHGKAAKWHDISKGW